MALTPQPQVGTLIWTDTFDTYTAGAALPAPWVNGGNTPVSSARSHSGSNSVAAGSGGNNSNAYRPLGSNLTQWYADFWMWTDPGGSASAWLQYVSFSSTTAGGSSAPCVGVDQTGAGFCGFSTNSGARWLSFSVSTSAWHHYLLEVTTAAAGSAKLTVDGTVVGTYSGDTRDNSGTGTSVANVWVVGTTIGGSPAAEFYVDDLSVYSGTLAPTTANLTQIAAEQWAKGTPVAQLTQIAIEQWATPAFTPAQVAMTQILVEQWAPATLIPFPSGGVQARVMVLA